MIIYKTKAEIELIRESSLLVGQALAKVAALIKPGATTLQLDTAAESFIRENNAVPSFKGYHDFPFTCCISVNDAVVHGFPSNAPLKEGDIVSVDIGVFKNGFHGDSAYTFAIKGASDAALQLMKVTKESLYAGIAKATAGCRVGDIGFAIQEYTERKHGYGVVRDLVGHGLGRDLHEDPQVPNYGKRGSGAKIQEDAVIAIEPMINMGKKDIYYDKDGWTVRTKDGKPAAHYEHTICIKKAQADILSSFEAVEAAEKANEYLCSGFY
jgi:methionyl aminopeptidase